MGWLFTEGQSRREMIDRLTKDEGPNVSEGKTYWYKTLARACVGNHLWAVMERTVQAEGGEKESVKFIALFLMQCDKGYGWGYKDMTESMHPYYYTCPKAFLDMVPVACQEWRDKVLAYHAKRGVKLAPGDRVRLNEGCKPNELRIISVKPLVGVTDQGARFRIPRKMIAGKVSETVEV
jgi:hypothetical protein